MGRITVDRDSQYAPCGYILCKVDDNGVYDMHGEETILVNVDWDFPCVASAFGYIPCECGFTDGTVDCEHKTVSYMIYAAMNYLDEHLGDVVEDPGYFCGE
jgi:hypothetical protein